VQLGEALALFAMLRIGAILLVHAMSRAMTPRLSTSRRCGNRWLRTGGCASSPTRHRAA